MDGLLGSQIMELEVYRLFAAASSQFEQAYNNDYIYQQGPYQQ